MPPRSLLAALAFVAVATACRPTEPVASPPAATASATFFEGMGTHHREVTTESADAQKYFDQGMAFLAGFNHSEAARSFQRAAELDPDCAMAWFGLAMTKGPHINNAEVPPEAEQEAADALQRARAAKGVSALEAELVAALSTRHGDAPPQDRRPLDEAYATAMCEVWAAHPDDADVGAWCAEAKMDLRPWDLYTVDGQPQPGTEDIVAILQRAIELDGTHPLALHLYIHATEASPHPERAMAAADGLRDLVPAHGHLQHMPSHIDVRTGRWAEAVAANQKAIEADTRYVEQVPEQQFYRLYMAHNRHMLGFAAMMSGRSKVATEAIDSLIASMPEAWVKENAAMADGFMAMPLEVRMRFGKWDEILEVPEFPDYLPLARTLRHYARGVALAALERPAEARTELAAFEEAAKGVAADAQFGVNEAQAIVGVARKLLEGEILYREGKVKGGIAALTEAVALEDALRYDEPPDWIQPVRHALGAVLLKEKRPKEAEAVFVRDLQKNPENGWGLWGLARSLRMQDRTAEADAVDERFAKVWSEADIELHSSCMCLPGV